MNAYHLSWTYYSFDRTHQEGFGIVDENGAPNERLAHLVEVYAQRIAGRNPEMWYSEKSFELRYDPIDSPAPTMVFVPGTLAGVRVTINGGETAFAPESPTLLHFNGDTTLRQVIRVEWQ